MIRSDAPSTSPQVILVDEADREIGQADKADVHRTGALHRAFSVFVFDGLGRMLLQRRAEDKYHSGGLFSNACCSHPAPGERTEAAAHRRLQEEMGFDCAIEEVFCLHYQVQFGEALFEHEFDHVFVGRYDGRPDPDPAEVAEWTWEPLGALARDLEARPEAYTYWFRLAFDPAVRSWQRLARAGGAATLARRNAPAGSLPVLRR